jgi:hypothetical protein
LRTSAIGLAHGRWFSPASSTTKIGRHDIAEILLKVGLKHQRSKPIFGHLTLRHFSEDLLTCHNTDEAKITKCAANFLKLVPERIGGGCSGGFLQSDQVQRYIYKINWLNIKVLKTAASSKSINLYLYTFIINSTCDYLNATETIHLNQIMCIKLQ